MGVRRKTAKKKNVSPPKKVTAKVTTKVTALDLRKFKKRLRVFGLNQWWVERVVYLVKKKRQLFAIKTKRRRKIKAKTFSIRRRSGVIFYSNYFKNIFNYYHSHPGQVFFSLIFSVLLFSGTFVFYERILKDLPLPIDLVEKKQIVTTRILDRHGQVLFKLYEDENRTLVPLSKIPLHVRQATIAIEDKDFYYHNGFSISGIVRAVISNFQGKPIQGGSTITQQLVKLRLLTSTKTYERKIKELIIAVLVEGTFTKDEILEMYFNEISYGGAIHGIEEASQKYFGKSVNQLSLAEGVLLAGLPAAPSNYTPFGAHPELAYARQVEVLRRMVEDGYISSEQAEAASQEILNFKSDSIDILAPHFVMYVKELLAKKYGEEVVNQGGLEVTTTLDLALQGQAQQIVTDEVASLARLRIQNGAALVTNPQTGEILAMVGSKDYFDFEHDGQVNVTLRPRQPGSSIKPITYALALERGKSVVSQLQDTPVTYKLVGSPPYSPKNYDGTYHGNVPLKQALASSYNVPAVKLLAELGVESLIDKGQLMGISTWQDRQRFGLSLTLGAGEVLMTDLAEVYGTFANQGSTIDLNPILEIKDKEGQVLYRNYCALDGINCSGVQSVDPRVAFLISDILSDNAARTPAFGAYSVLNIPDQQVAVKTGTTNLLRDNWTIGYTTDRVVAVWVGNNDNTPMSYVASGITGASPIWNKIMRLNLNADQPHHFASPSGVVAKNVCARSGTLPCQGCLTTSEYFIYGSEPQFYCAGWSADQLPIKKQF